MAGNAVIGALRVELGLNSAQFEDGLKSSQGKLANFSKVAAGLGVAVGAAVAGAGIALAGAVKKSIDAADEMSKTAQKVGIAVDELSRLKHAADLSDVGLDGLSTGLKRLSANMAQVADDAKGPAAEAFRALGISVTDSNGQLKSGSVVMQELAGKFGGMADGAGKTALAMAIFGKSGADLIPMLNAGSAGLAEMMHEADALGIVIDQKTGAAAEAFNDNLTRLGKVKVGLTTQITARLLPTLVTLSDVFVSGAKDAHLLDGVAAALSVTLKALATAGVIVATAFKNTFTLVAGAVAVMGKILHGDFVGAWETAQQVQRNNLASLANGAKSIADIWTKTGSLTKAAAPKVGADLAAPMMHATKAVKKQVDEQAKALASAKKAADDYVASLAHEIETYGLRSEQVKIMDAQAKAAEFLEKGLTNEAAAVLRLVEALMALQAIQLKVIDKDVQMVRTPEDLAKAWAKAEAQMKDPFEQVLDASYDISAGFDQIGYALEHKDWMTAVAGLKKSITSVTKAFQELGAVQGFAALASAAGSAVGGVGGSTLSGIGAGMSLGMTLGGPIGAGIGAVIGGIGGFLSGKSAKKKAKQQAAEQAAAAAAQKAAQVAAARRELEIRLMELSGDAVGALAARRADELAALDPSLQEMQKQVWAAEDLAEAEAKLADARAQAEAEAAAAAAEAEAKAQEEAARAADIVRTQRELDIEMMEAVGDAEGALAAQREDALAALPEEVRGLQQAVWNVIDANEARRKSEEALAAAAEVAAQAAEAAADAERQMAEERQAQVDLAADAVETAAQALKSAYTDQAKALQGVIDKMGGFADAIAAFRKTLLSDSAGSSAQYGLARAAFDRTAASAAMGDEAALGGLTGAAQAFLEVSKANAPNARAYQQDVQRVRRALDLAEAAARQQVDVAAQQLAQLKATVSGLIKLDESVLSVGQAIQNLSSAITAAALMQAANGNEVIVTGFAPGVADSLGTPNAMVAASVGATSPTAAMATDVNAALVSIALSTRSTAKILDQFNGEGMPEVRDVA